MDNTRTRGSYCYDAYKVSTNNDPNLRTTAINYQFKYISTDNLEHVIKSVQKDKLKKKRGNIWSELCRSNSNSINSNNIAHNSDGHLNCFRLKNQSDKMFRSDINMSGGNKKLSKKSTNAKILTNQNCHIKSITNGQERRNHYLLQQRQENEEEDNAKEAPEQQLSCNPKIHLLSDNEIKVLVNGAFRNVLKQINEDGNLFSPIEDFNEIRTSQRKDTSKISTAIETKQSKLNNFDSKIVVDTNKSYEQMIIAQNLSISNRKDSITKTDRGAGDGKDRTPKCITLYSCHQNDSLSSLSSNDDVHANENLSRIPSDDPLLKISGNHCGDYVESLIDVAGQNPIQNDHPHRYNDNFEILHDYEINSYSKRSGKSTSSDLYNSIRNPQSNNVCSTSSSPSLQLSSSKHVIMDEMVTKTDKFTDTEDFERFSRKNSSEKEFRENADENNDNSMVLLEQQKELQGMDAEDKNVEHKDLQLSDAAVQYNESEKKLNVEELTDVQNEKILTLDVDQPTDAITQRSKKSSSRSSHVFYSADYMDNNNESLSFASSKKSPKSTKTHVQQVSSHRSNPHENSNESSLNSSFRSLINLNVANDIQKIFESDEIETLRKSAKSAKDIRLDFETDNWKSKAENLKSPKRSSNGLNLVKKKKRNEVSKLKNTADNNSKSARITGGGGDSTAKSKSLSLSPTKSKRNNIDTSHIAMLSKITSYQEDIINITKIIRQKIETVTPPQDIIERNRREKRVTEFSTRFTRQYLYQIEKTIEEIRQTPKEIFLSNRNDCQIKICTLYGIIQQSLRTFLKQVNSFLVDLSPKDYEALMRLIIDGTKLCRHKRIFGRNDSIVKAIIEDCKQFLEYLQILQANYTAYKAKEKVHKPKMLKRYDDDKWGGRNNLSMYDAKPIPSSTLPLYHTAKRFQTKQNINTTKVNRNRLLPPPPARPNSQIVIGCEQSRSNSQDKIKKKKFQNQNNLKSKSSTKLATKLNKKQNASKRRQSPHLLSQKQNDEKISTVIENLSLNDSRQSAHSTPSTKRKSTTQNKVKKDRNDHQTMMNDNDDYDVHENVENFSNIIENVPDVRKQISNESQFQNEIIKAMQQLTNQKSQDIFNTLLAKIHEEQQERDAVSSKV